MEKPVFYTYILTNRSKTVLYTGMTNNLAQRLMEHWFNKDESFTSKYKVYYLVWFQETRYVLNSINAEKEIKQMSRSKKMALIDEFNPSWEFLNESFTGTWPPSKDTYISRATT